MRRREFVTLVGGAAAWPLKARAQQPMPVIGLLSSLTPEGGKPNLAAFRKALADVGYVEGQNAGPQHAARARPVRGRQRLG